MEHQRLKVRRFTTVVAAGIVIPAAVVLSNAASQPTQAEVETRVVFAPIPATGCEGTHYVAYELHLSNFYRSTGTLRLDSVEVRSGTTALARYDASDLETRVARFWADPRRGRTIESGRSAVVHIWVTLPRETPVPGELQHRLVFTTEKGIEQIVDGVITPVRPAADLRIGPPLRGGDWFIGNGPADYQAAHWGSMLALNGRLTVPQRFAIDFIGLAADGRAVRGDVRKSTNADWHGFGATVVAVADGVVRNVRDGVPDHPPLVPVPPPPDTSAASVYGNFVVLEIGPGTFAHYAHLQERSVSVRLDQRVKRGDVLGRLGNSGNTNAPHLHFNVTDAVGPELSEGLPFAFDRFERLGETTVDRALAGEGSDQKPFSPTACTGLPLGGTVVRFR